MNKQEYLKAKSIYTTLQYSLANVKFETVTIADTDEVINISGREVGAEVFIGDGQPVADGTYLLADGFEFEVKDSLISKVISEVKAVEDAPTDAPVELADETPAVSVEDFKALQDDVASLKEQLQSTIDAMDLAKQDAVVKDEEFNRKMNSINTAFSALAKMPAESSKVNDSPKSLLKKETDNAALRNLFEAAKN